jgi:hypothetical protein
MSQQIQITGGAKVRNLEGVLTGTAGVVNALGINVPSGIPQLDGSGKILVSQLPNSVMEYKGTWNAATNTPTLADGTGNQGDVYLCNVAGTANFGSGPIAFFVGDQVIYSGTIWQRASGATGTVTSVAVTESGDSLNVTGSPITTSGTINIGFNGNSGQYINGAGNLTTFPSLAGFVTSVTATAPLVSSGGTTPDLSIPAASASVDGYLDNADWTTFNNKQNAITLTTTGTSGVSTLIGSTLNIPNYSTDLSGYVPYTGATANVNLGTFDLTADVITGATGSFASSGGSNTFAINHSSGSGIALNITKGGNGEGLYINKTSGSGNAATIIGTLNATTLVKSGGTSSQFLKADGSVDSSAYITLTSLSGGTGISYNNTTGVITNSAPDQTVSLTAGAGISISGTYPSFTIASTITQYTDALARAAISLTTTGSSGASTYNNTTGILNVPNYTLAGLGGQPLATNLTSLSGLTYASTSFVKMTAAGTFALDTNTYALASALGDYLPLAGGTMSGSITYSGYLLKDLTSVNKASIIVNWSGTGYWGLGPNGSHIIRLDQANPTTGAWENATDVVLQLGNNKTVLANTDIGVTVQGLLTNPVTGTGTIGKVARFSAASGISDSYITDEANNPTIITKDAESITQRILLITPFTSTNASLVQLDNAGAGSFYTGRQNSAGNSVLISGTGAYASVLGHTGTQTLHLVTNSLSRVQIDGSGNLGLGVTPSDTLSYGRALDIQGTAGSALYVRSGTNSSTVYGLFSYDNNTVRTNIGGIGTGNYLRFISGGSEAMRLNASGNLAVGTTTDAGYKLDVNGTGRFYNTGGSNTLIISGTGSPYKSILDLQYSENLYGATFTYDANAETLTIENYGRSAGGTTQGDINFRTKVSNTTPTNILNLDGFTGTATFSREVVARGNIIMAYDTGGTNQAILSHNGTSAILYSSGNTTKKDFTIYRDGGVDAGLIIKGSTGNVGLSVINPAAKMSIGVPNTYTSRGTFANSALNIYDPTDVGVYSQITFGYEASRTYSAAYMGYLSTSSSGGGFGDLVFGTRPSPDIQPTERFRVLSSGPMLINTSTGVSGGGTLQVNGDVNINGNFKINGTIIGGGGGSGVTGSGTANFITKWSGASTLSNSIIQDNGSSITIIGGVEAIARFAASGDGTIIIGGTSAQGVSSGEQYITYQNGTTNTNAWMVGMDDGEDWRFAYGAQGEITDANSLIRLTQGGNFIIGSVSDNGYKLQINGSASFAYGYFSNFKGSSAPNDILFGNSGSTLEVLGNFKVQGTTTSTGGFFDTSDSRLKIVIKDYDNAKGIEKVEARLYLKNNKKELGYFAQDLQEILPSAVSEGEDGFLTLSYSQVHTAKIAYLEDKVAQLEKLIKSLL